jgi:hypothetical protein
MRLALVSCVKLKGPEPVAAKDLYVSALFRAMRHYAETHADRWMILSAKHGLLAPNTVIGRYERTLNQMSAKERREWSTRVLSALEAELSGVDTVVLLAGERYREGIVPALKERRLQVEVPLEGKGLGQQLQWLKQQRSSE